MRILFIVAAMLVTACGGNANEAASANAAYVRSPGKPLHPIQVRAAVEGPLQAGRESEASLTVTSSRPVASMEVELQPELATVISGNRFARRFETAELEPPAARGAARSVASSNAATFHFRLRPASDAPQPVRVRVRVTAPDGSVLSRELTLALADKAEPPRREKRRQVNVDAVPEPAGDAIVPARQQLSRGE